MEITLYKVLAEDIIKKISEGVYPPGTKIPSEAELCAGYNMSKTTVAKATQLLIQMGYLYSIPKIGCFVCEKSEKVFLLKYDVYTMQLKMADSMSILGMQIEKGDESFASTLRYTMLFRKIDSPVFLTQTWVGMSGEDVPDFDQLKKSDFLTMVSDHHNLIGISKRIRITAGAADVNTAAFLEVPVGHPMLIVENEYISIEGVRFAWMKAFYPSESFGLTLTCEE